MTLSEAIEAVAALASTGALIAALVALRNQRKELALQRSELKLQREELAANREVMRDQAEQARFAAAAQMALACSQEKLAIAQQLSSEMALETHLLQVRKDRAEIQKHCENLRGEIDDVYGTQELEQSELLEDLGEQLKRQQALVGAADTQIERLEQMSERTRAALAAVVVRGESDDR
jgi:hypothetical protein